MTIHAATLSTIRHQIARIPAGPGRSADEFKEDLRRTLDCMEVAETLETPAEPLRLRLTLGSYYRNGLGETIGPITRNDNSLWPFAANGYSYRVDGCHGYRELGPHALDLIAEVPTPVAPDHIARDDTPTDADAFYVDTIHTPIVPVTVDRNTQIVDPDTGCLTELGAALLNGKDAQIAELRKMIEREVV